MNSHQNPVNRKLESQISKAGRSTFEWLLNQRKLSFKCIVAIATVSVALTLCFYHLYTGYFGQVEAHIFRSTHLSFILVLVFLFFPVGRKSWEDKLNWGFLLDLACIGLIIAIEVYILYDFKAFCYRIISPSMMDAVVGAILVVILLEATRRTVGLPMLLVCVFFIAYALHADHFIGILRGPPVSYHRLFSYMLMEEGGIYGIPVMAMASFITLFLIFGTMLLRTGAGRFFLDLAIGLTARRVGGPAKAAVTSSMVMGTMSGSCVANVVTTGSFTIPLMKRVGYRPAFAGAVEAIASTGGQFMPPIMGAAAFIIAAFLGVTYLEVVLRAAIPGALYYLALYFMVDFEARKQGLRTPSEVEVASVHKTLKKGWYHLVSIIVLVTLIVLGYSVSSAALWGIVCVFILSLVSKEKKMTPVGLLITLEEAARTAVPVSVACAAAGLVIGSMDLSGLGLRLSGMIISISGGHLWILLPLTMIMAIILGMGVPTTAVYVIVSALIAPVLVKMGMVEMSAHLFVFYFGVISAVTPPVCLAAYAAAGVAKSNPMRTGYTAVKVGLPCFIVPFLFLYNPGLVLVGSWLDIMLSIPRAVVSIISLAAGVAGWHIKKATLLERGVLVLVSVLLIYPSYLTSILGLGLLATVLIRGGAYQILKQRLLNGKSEETFRSR